MHKCICYWEVSMDFSYPSLIIYFKFVVNIFFNPLKHTFFLTYDWRENWCSGVFKVADYESEVKIHKLKIADPIWLRKMQSFRQTESAKLNPPFWIPKFWVQIRNHRPQKPHKTKSKANSDTWVVENAF